MTDLDRAAVETRLQERSAELTRRLERLRREGTGMVGSELADYDQHPADSGTETLEQEIDETTDMMLADELRQVTVALERLADGSYGKCVDCGREIPRERLEAIPESVRCLDDQRRYEGQLRASGPPPQDI